MPVNEPPASMVDHWFCPTQPGEAQLASLYVLQRLAVFGVSTSHGNKHDVAERVLRSEPLDVLQITYNFADTRAEPLMNLAAERGLAVIINRPFDGGDLFDQVGRRPLPPWAAELGCANWAQYFLKWIVGHPAITCTIPGTGKPEHMADNVGAGFGVLPDSRARTKMAEYFDSL